MYETKHKYFQKLFIRFTFYSKSNADVNCVVVSLMSVYVHIYMNFLHTILMSYSIIIIIIIIIIIYEYAISTKARRAIQGLTSTSFSNINLQVCK
jgi:hypothetical protein